MEDKDSRDYPNADAVLWHSAAPIRLPKPPGPVGRLFARHGHWLYLPIYLYLMLRDLSWGLIGWMIFVALGVACIGLTIRNLKVDPTKLNKAIDAVPRRLTATHLVLADPDEQTVTVDSIKSLTTDFHDGSPALTLTLPDAAYTLITAQRESLRAALFSLRPDLGPTP